MINPLHLLEMVVRPSLQAIGLHSRDAELLVLGTAYAESLIGDDMYLAQQQGPALGLWQCEPDTHADIWVNFLSYRPELAQKVLRLCPPEFLQADQIPEHAALIGCLPYAAAICRLVYRRSPEPIPASPEGHADYWVQWYNRGGKGTAAKYLQAWARVA